MDRFSNYADYKDLLLRISEIEEELALLPAGSIGKKTVNGKIYYYHRFYENGKRKEKYIPQDRLADMKIAVEKRKALEEELKELNARKARFSADTPSSSVPAQAAAWSYNGIPLTFESTRVSEEVFRYHSNVIKGDALRFFANQSSGFGRRECFHLLQDYIAGAFPDKVLILYGLRRTGKTTMMRQAISEMPDECLAKTAFIQVVPGVTLADINTDLKILASQGFQYIFID